jgi:hypothetical protein
MRSRAPNPTSGSIQIGQTRRPVSLVGLNLKAHGHFPDVRINSGMLDRSGMLELALRAR